MKVELEQCKIKSLCSNCLTGKAEVTIEMNIGFLKHFEPLLNKVLTAVVKPFKKKRSLNANAYAWHLIGEIADVLRADKDSVYLIMLKRYGQSDVVSVKEHVPPEDYFKYYECVGSSVLHGNTYKHYRVFKGSSDFDTREMSILIDGIVSEANEMGIQTLSERELSLMKEDWRE